MLCFLFSIYSGAQQKSNENRIELNEKPQKTRDSKGDGERERARLCEWDASRMCTIQTSTRCNSEKLPDAMKSLWKTFNYRARPQLKPELLKRPTHIRIRIRIFAHTSALGVGPEDQRGANKLSVENRIDWASSLPLYIPPSLPQVQLPQCARVEPTAARRNRGRQVAAAASLSPTSLLSSSTLCWG